MSCGTILMMVLSPLFGVIVGFSLGLTGGGGSIFAVSLLVYCQSGNRSAQAGRALVAMGWGTVCHLQGGPQAWKAAGLPTERSTRTPISLQRQVQITAGSLVLLGTVLGAFVSPWFLLLSGGVGAGLTFAGITDTCGMALLLAKLPYNQRV